MNPKEKFNKVIKYSILFGIGWTVIALLFGVINRVQLILFFPSSDTILGYGILRPVFTTALIFGAVLSLFTGIAYHSLQRKLELKLELAARIGMYVQQLAVLLSIISIVAGYNEGREYGEAGWIPDCLTALSIFIFLVVVLVSLKGAESPSRGQIFIVLSAAGALLVFEFGNAGMPYDIFSSVPYTAGLQDASVQEFYRSGVLGYFLLFPLFAILYSYVPAYHNIQLYSSSMANFQASAMALLIPVAGAANLAFSPVPGGLQTFGMICALALGAALLAGAMNVKYTLNNGPIAVDQDDISKFFSRGVFFLILFTTVRAIGSFRWAQERFAYTWINSSDISLDTVTYGMLILFGSAFIASQQLQNRKASAGLVKSTLISLTAGSALLFTGTAIAGFFQSIALRSTGADGALSVKTWQDTLLSGSFISSKDPAVQFLSGAGVLSLTGIAVIFIGILLGTLTLLLVFFANAQPYGEPDLHKKIQAPMHISQGAH